MEWMLWIGGASVVLCFVLLTIPMTIRAKKHPEISQARDNARQLGLALFEFEMKYGKFPDSSTAATVRGQTGSVLTLPDRTSNDLFAQLLASGIVASEKPFFAKAKGMKRKPDNVFDTDATILEHGECAFAYISGLTAKGNPSRPIAFGPVIPGTRILDKKSCSGRAIILKLDNSVTTTPITPAGKVIYNGLDLLDPRQPFWHGKAPDVKWPK